jgi:hypothetical protein
MKLADKAGDEGSRYRLRPQTVQPTIPKRAAGASTPQLNLHTRGDQIPAHSAANKIHATVNYVRQTNVKGMVDDSEDILKRYPAQTLAAAAFLGFLVGRAFCRYDQSHRTGKRAMVIDPAFSGFRDEFLRVSAAGSVCH